MPRISLAVNLATRDGTLTKDAQLKNCIIEKTDNGLAITKRPGLSLSSALGAGTAQGGIYYNGQAVWVLGDSLATNGAGIPTLSAFSSTTSVPKPTNADVGTGKAGYLVDHGGNLYSIGGRNNSDTTVSVYKSTNHGANWSTISTPWTSTILATTNNAVSLGGFIYAIGTTTSPGRVERSADGVTWTLCSTDLTGGTGHDIDGLIVHNNLLYALETFSSINPKIWSSPDGAVWTAVSSGIAALANRSRMGFASLNGKLYLIGGIAGATIYDTVYVSSDNGANWTLLVSGVAFGVRAAMATWVANGRLWIGGGATTAALLGPTNDVWSSSDGSAWLLAAATSAWSARKSPSFAVHNGSLYIGAGLVAGPATVNGLFFATPTVSSTITLSPAPATSGLPFDLTLIPATATTPVGIFLKSTEVAYYYNGLTVTRITDADYPSSTVRGVVYLDGSIYVMNAKGIIYGSDLNDPTSWNALNFISANAEADAGVAIARQLNYIIAFKEFSTEVFYDAGNATGSPLSKVGNALLEVGLAASGSIAYSDNTIYFMSQSRQKGRSIMKMNGYTPEPISSPDVERVLNADDLDTIYSFVVKLSGHTIYLLTLVTSDFSLAFDISTSAWTRWTTLSAAGGVSVTSLVVQSDGTILATMAAPHGKSDGDPTTIAGASQSACNGRFNIFYDSSIHSTSQFSYEPSSSVTGSITGTITAVFYTESSFRAAYYARSTSSDLILDKSNGNVYSFDASLYDDNSVPINVESRTQIIDDETIVNKFQGRMAIIGDRNSTTIIARWSDDDYQTYSQYQTIYLNDEQPELRRIGRFRRRSFHVRHTDNSKLRLVGIEPVIKGGG